MELCEKFENWPIQRLKKMMMQKDFKGRGKTPGRLDSCLIQLLHKQGNKTYAD